MSLESVLEEYPKNIVLKDGLECVLRPIATDDAKAFHEFFCAMPPVELIFNKNRVTSTEVTDDWCRNIDLGRNFPLFALSGGKIMGVATLHQQLGGWKRHIGRVSVQVHPEYRQRGLARTLVTEIVDVARQCGLERVEAEFMGEQVNGLKLFAMLGFNSLVRLEDYVKDMQAIPHDYILMGLDLITDEEYAGVGG